MVIDVWSRRYQKGSTILTTNRNVASWGTTSSQTAPSPPRCWTGSSTEVWCSPSPETVTGYPPTRLRPANNDRTEATTRISRPPEGVPLLARFRVISIYMYDETNHQLPHFHAGYAEHSVSVAIRTLGPLAGRLPRTTNEVGQKIGSGTPARTDGRLGDGERRAGAVSY